jgi:hypothetical protein
VSEPKFDDNGNPVILEILYDPSLPLLTVGPGVQALTINFDNGKIGIFDSFSPVALTINIVQRKLLHWWRDDNEKPWQKTVYNICFWSFSLGLDFSITPDNQVKFGIAVAPYIIKIMGFNLGVGIEWRNVDKAEFTPDNFYFVIPFSFTFN